MTTFRVEEATGAGAERTPGAAGDFAVLNPQYPSSWWALGFSDEVRVGEVVPAQLLERKVLFWRDSAGTLHCQSAICPHLGADIGYGGEIVNDTVRCPFHGYRFDGQGALCERPGETTHAPRRLSLQNYEVEEYFGMIHVWNGIGPPDHRLPGLAEIFPDVPGITPDDITVMHCAFHLPFPAKWFAENTADANHFSGLHRACAWGDVTVLEESAYHLKVRHHFAEPVPIFGRRYLREQLRAGQLTNPAVAGYAMDMTTYGGGVHLVEADFGDGDPARIRRVARVSSPTGISRAFAAWTPVTERSHWNGYTILVPKVRLPIPKRVLASVLNSVASYRVWGPTIQDVSVMLYREEPEDPCYGRLDRGLVKFRRFWDSRIADRELWRGDGIHSNGLAAGIRWRDRPEAADRLPAAGELS